MIRIAILRPGSSDPFPAVASALDEPNGLLAAGGDLSPSRLLDAYRRGIFPWYSEGEPLLWWSPDPRMVFATAGIHVPQRLRRWLRRCEWTVRADCAFDEVIHTCAAPRTRQFGTWITPSMLAAYQRLHALGHAHSVEVVDGDGRLAGGIYGVAIGRMFFGESMFSAASNGSKVALFALCRTLARWRFPLLDAQVASSHLRTLGAFEMPRAEFCARIERLCAEPLAPGSWRDRWPAQHASELVSSGTERVPEPLPA